MSHFLDEDELLHHTQKEEEEEEEVNKTKKYIKGLSQIVIVQSFIETCTHLKVYTRWNRMSFATVLSSFASVYFQKEFRMTLLYFI